MAGAVAGSRVEDGLIGHASLGDGRHRVVTIDYQSLSTEFTEALLLVTSEHVKGVHYVLYLVPFDAVQVEINCVKFSSKQDSTPLIPFEWSTIVSKILCKPLHIPGRVTQLKYS